MLVKEPPDGRVSVVRRVREVRQMSRQRDPTVGADGNLLQLPALERRSLDGCTRYASGALSREERENTRVRASSTCHAVCSTQTESPSFDIRPSVLRRLWLTISTIGAPPVGQALSIDCDEL
jgi:hypothetical protein